MYRGVRAGAAGAVAVVVCGTGKTAGRDVGLADDIARVVIALAELIGQAQLSEPKLADRTLLGNRI